MNMTTCLSSSLLETLVTLRNNLAKTAQQQQQQV